MTNPETARLVDRLISYRDDLRIGRGTVTREAMDLMADAANALTAYDKTMAKIAEQTPTDPPLERGTTGDTDAEHIQCSIALSLKRIADALHGDDQNTGMKHALADMAHRAYNGWGPSS